MSATDIATSIDVDLSKPLWDMKHALLDKYHFE